MAVKSKSAQSFVPIKDVRDGTVILKDGSMRMILMASSLNFALKSEDEQTALLLQFQSFLNSIEFTIQIVIQSRKLDIRPYLSLLKERLKEQPNDLLHIQTKEYMDFIQSFTEQTNIMTKTFFIVVPYSSGATSSSKKGGLGSFLPSKNTEKKTKEQLDVEVFEESRSQLEQRANVVKQGLARTGIRVVSLGTEEIIEVYYKLFNPSDVEKQLRKE